MYICAQLLGAMFGALLVWLAYKNILMQLKMLIQSWQFSVHHPIYGAIGIMS